MKRPVHLRPVLEYAFPVVLLALLGVPRIRSMLFAHELRWLYLALGAFGFAHLATPVCRWIALRLGIVDMPGGRKVHVHPTPFLGGLAIYAAFAVVVVVNFYFSVELKGVALGATLILIVGLIDDVRELPALWKLIAQIAAVLILIKYHVVLTFLPDVWWGYVGEWVITMLWVLGITNAMNFLDGLDGLASGVSAICALFFGLAAVQTGQEFMMFLSMALLGSCLGFLPHNFWPRRPARIFLGDTGATFLGFTLAGIGIMGEWATNNLAALAVPLIILGVPIFDTTLTSVMRIKNGHVSTFNEWLSFTGQDHFHHRLVQLGITKGAAVLIIYGLSGYLGLSSLLLRDARGLDALIMVAQVFVVFTLIGSFVTTRKTSGGG